MILRIIFEKNHRISNIRIPVVLLSEASCDYEIEQYYN
jgi:hypothetical protein